MITNHNNNNLMIIGSVIITAENEQTIKGFSILPLSGLSIANFITYI